MIKRGECSQANSQCNCLADRLQEMESKARELEEGYLAQAEQVCRMRQQRDELHQYLQFMFCIGIGALNQKEDVPDALVTAAKSILESLPDLDKSGVDLLHEVSQAIASVKGGAA